MTSHDHVIDPHDLDPDSVTADDADQRAVDPDEIDEIPVPLDADPEVPIEDALEQHQSVPLDDERIDGG